MEIFILYKFYIFFILKSYFKKNLCPQTRTAEHTCKGPPAAYFQHRRHEGVQTGRWKSSATPFRDIGSHRPPCSFHNSLYNWGPHFKHLHTDTPGNNEKCLSSFIANQMLYFSITANCLCLCTETDKKTT